MDWVKVAKVSDFDSKDIIQVEVDDELVALYALDGKYFALCDICSHAEAYLSEGEVEDGTIACPLHGAKFDIRSGKNLTLPAVVPVDKYEVKVEGKDIFVAIPD